MISYNQSSDSGEESDRQDDVVAHYSSAESSESKNNAEESLVPVIQLPRQTRSGRNIETSFSRYHDYFLY